MSFSRNIQVPILPEVRSSVVANISDACRSLLWFALKHQLEPTAVNLEGLTRSAVFFPPPLQAKLIELQEQTGLTIQQLVAGLCQAAVNAQEAQKQEAKALEEARSADAFEGDFRMRPAQSSFYMNLLDGLGLNGAPSPYSPQRITIAEASTGVGKGRALMAAAIRAAKEKKGCVIVAAPTIVICNQLARELQVLQQTDKFGTEIKAMRFPGAAEFVDDLRLKEWITQFPDDTNTPVELVNWVNSGGLHDQSDSLAKMCAEHGITLKWQAQDLIRIAPNFPYKDFLLYLHQEKGIESEARTLLKKIRKLAFPSLEEEDDVYSSFELATKKIEEPKPAVDIIICTHMMLALAQKTQWRLLPAPAVLLVDEAHLLEQTISKINSQQISFWALRFRLAHYCRQHGLSRNTRARELLRCASDLMKYLDAVDTANGALRVEPGSELFIRLAQDVRFLSKGLSSKLTFKSGAFSDKGLIRDISAAADLFNSRNPVQCYLEFSPSKRYPSLNVGAPSIAPQAGALWKAAQHGVILASATLYTPDESANQKCDYFVRNLCLPLARLHTPVPVVLPDIYSVPTLYVPSPGAITRFSRPTGVKGKNYTEEDEARWYQIMAAKIGEIVQKRNTGGSLVLLNSYEQLAGIVPLIDAAMMNPIRAVVQTKNESMETLVRRFKTLHGLGYSPVMFALGGAWTGLDLRQDGVPPERDTLLKTLIIGCAPLGQNKTITMQHRVNTRGFSAVSSEGLLILKQGLGRLIRCEGLTDREIWMLDGRIYDKDWAPQFSRPARRMLLQYNNRRTFE